MSINVIYFSNVTGNTERFIKKLDLDCHVDRIPIRGEYDGVIDAPYVLITPTYNATGVPVQVRKFLNKAENRRNLRGVIASGNKNFGKDFAIAGRAISRKCEVPLLYVFEIFGTPEDVEKVKEGLKNYVK